MKILTDEEIAVLVKQNYKIYDEIFDVRFAENLVDTIYDLFNKCYFRSRFIGFENMPERNNPKHPLIYASNHSGMAFPWDGIILVGGIFKINNKDFRKSARPLSAPMLSQSPLMNPFMINNFWKMVGSVDASTLNFETMMQYTESNLIVYPEGVPGIGKGFNNKYKLQRFATSFVRMSIKYRTDIMPISTVNGEYINPHTYSIEFLNKIVQKIGIPFIPIGILTLFLILQPWLFYYASPANLTYVLGEKISPYEWTNKPHNELSREELLELTGRVQEIMQNNLNKAVEKYGDKPFGMAEFLKCSTSNLKRFPFFLPFAWPVIVAEFSRRFVELKEDPVVIKYGFWQFIRMMFKNPFTFFFFIPVLGWIPIAKRGVRKRF